MIEISKAQKQNAIITKNGTLTAAKSDKKAAFKHLCELFSGISVSDEEAEAVKNERLN